MPEDYNEKASNILKSILTRRNIKYHELATKLNRMGINETQSSVSNKINRGTFSFIFFIQCLEALNIRDFRID